VGISIYFKIQGLNKKLTFYRHRGFAVGLLWRESRGRHLGVDCQLLIVEGENQWLTVIRRNAACHDYDSFGPWSVRDYS